MLKKTPRKHALIIAFCIAMLLSQAAPSYAMDIDDLKINRNGDLEMSCNALSKEVSSMEGIISSAQETQEKSQIASTGVGVAKTVGSYLVGSLGGALGILAAGYLVSEATDNKTEDAMALQDAAAQRRSFMTGIYNARDCAGPLVMASIEPAAGKKLAPAKRVPREPHYND